MRPGRVLSDRKAECLRIQEKKGKLRLDFWIQISLTGWSKIKWRGSALLARIPSECH